MRKPVLLAVPLLVVSCTAGSAGTGTVSTTGSADAQTVTVEMPSDLKYHPSTVEARVGTVTLDVSNTDVVPHDLVFDAARLGQTGTIDGKSDTTLKVTFDTAGTFRFTCSFHSGMKGKVVVA
jgi:plastocyanin